MSIRRYSFVVALAVFLSCFGLAAADDRDRDQDRLRDGSCQEDVIEGQSWKIVAKDQDRDQDRDRDRLKDGSCQDDAVEGASWKIVAADQTRTRSQERTRDQNRLKNGSSEG